MYEYVIDLVVPVIPTTVEPGSEEYQTWEIAKFNFDPCLQIGDEVLISNLKIGNQQDEPFNFMVGVIKREKEILVAKKPEESIFRTLITVEVKDKDEFPRFIEIMKRYNPDAFKN
ncbi:hypothetical protein [Floridanema evergladense]|uniref:Uncharacterized protein n=1 Tax=Floridaenema evergladense BLCC-F167 TaxID=3153639 RepID=A0ABV4WJV8_9CYAN